MKKRDLYWIRWILLFLGIILLFGGIFFYSLIQFNVSYIKEDIYEEICEKIKDKNVKIVVDSTKKLLLNTLKYRPFLIKPNHHELGEIFNVQILNQDQAIEYAKKLQQNDLQTMLNDN